MAKEETLISIAKKLGVPAATLKKSNKHLLDKHLAESESKPEPKKSKTD